MNNKMKISLVSLLVGFLFSLGLGLAGMTQPEKIINFLNVFGDWDPSLIFVMVGGIAVHFVTYRWIRRRSSPLLTTKWHIPNKKEVTSSLVIGSLLFGIGWGLAGYCPGPAVTSLATFSLSPVVFVFSMIAGMFLFRLIDKKLKLRK